MDAYTGFAEVYDLFMDNVPYEEWGSYLTGLLREYGICSGTVAELGCGTGKMTRLLAAAGYDMIGVDASEEMLELARTDNGRSLSGFAPVDLSRLVSDALLPFEPVFFEKGLTLTSDIVPEVTVLGSGQHLRQVVDILLDNAQKYSDVPGEVTAVLTRQGSRCRLSVSNPGPALSKEELRSIFERFYRVDKSHSRQIGGTGLGLSIVKHGAIYHNAKVEMESTPGRGTSITIVFPEGAAK